MLKYMHDPGTMQFDNGSPNFTGPIHLLHCQRSLSFNSSLFSRLFRLKKKSEKKAAKLMEQPTKYLRHTSLIASLLVAVCHHNRVSSLFCFRPDDILGHGLHVWNICNGILSDACSYVVFNRLHLAQYVSEWNSSFQQVWVHVCVVITRV